MAQENNSDAGFIRTSRGRRRVQLDWVPSVVAARKAAAAEIAATTLTTSDQEAAYLRRLSLNGPGYSNCGCT